jgi:CubicO group peptidase (beta-lactamase class C family)
MKKYILIFLLLPLYSPAQDLEKFIDSFATSFNKPNYPGTMILVAQDGKPILQKVYGMASLEFNVPLRADHNIPVGSISKQFTAVAVLQLAQQGKLNLSDDIRKYIPALNTQGYVVTIDNMLSHTSGIASTERKGYGNWIIDHGVGAYPDEYLGFISNEKFLFAPGTNFSYNNVAYVIDAMLIEKVSGMKYADYLKEYVFKPAGMLNTFIANDLDPLNNVPSSYSKGYGGKWRNENRRPLWAWGTGAGNIITTMADMLNWDIALREGKVLPLEWLEKAWTPYKLKNGLKVNYGYGWDIGSYNDFRFIAHTGATFAYNAVSVQIPEKKIYVFIAACYITDAGAMAKRILSRMLNIPSPKVLPKAEGNLSDYVGSYDILHPGSRKAVAISDRPIYAHITTSGDTLYVQFTERQRTILRPVDKDLFVTTGGAPFLFNRDEKGAVVSLQAKSYLFGSPMSEEKYKKLPLIKIDHEKFAVVSPDILKTYTGTFYKTEGDDYLFVEVSGSKIYAYDIDVSQKYELLPLNDHQFVRKEIEDVTYTFKKSSKGIMTAKVEGNRTLEFRKIAD